MGIIKTIYELVNDGTLMYCNLSDEDTIQYDNEFEAKLKLLGEMFHCDPITSTEILKSSEEIIKNEKEMKASRLITYTNWFSEHFADYLTYSDICIIAKFFNENVPKHITDNYMRFIEASPNNETDEET